MRGMAVGLISEKGTYHAEDQNTITVDDSGDPMSDSDDGAVGEFYA